MNYTIKDVAQRAGVSPAAVSLVINNKPNRISQAKKEEILRIAQELNYTPNHFAKSLVTKTSDTIALIVPDIENNYFSSLIKFIEKDLRDSGYFTLILISNESIERDIEMLLVSTTRNVQGIFFIPSNDAINNPKKIISVLKNIKVPVVLLDRDIEDSGLSCVHYNNQLGGYLAATHLLKKLQKEHRNIAIISSKENSKTGYARFQGNLDAFKEIQIDGFDVDYEVFPARFKVEDGYSLAPLLVKRKFDGIICDSDMVAIGLIQHLNEMHSSLYNPVNIIGYDNLSLTKMLSIPISSIDQDLASLSETGVRLILDEIKCFLDIDNKYTSLNTKIILTPKLIKR